MSCSRAPLFWRWVHRFFRLTSDREGKKATISDHFGPSSLSFSRRKASSGSLHWTFRSFGDK
jgi:hypothetical protein